MTPPNSGAFFQTQGRYRERPTVPEIVLTQGTGLVRLRISGQQHEFCVSEVGFIYPPSSGVITER